MDKKRKFMKIHFSKNGWITRWHRAKSRCINPKDPDYKYYGKRGIKFFITKDDFYKLWIRDEAWKMKCPWLKLSSYKKNNLYWV